MTDFHKCSIRAPPVTLHGIRARAKLAVACLW